MKNSLPLVVVVIVLFLVTARVQGIRLDAESHEAFNNQMVHVSNRYSHTHYFIHTVQ
jgi:protein phosphatase 2C family protein 2/3